MPSVTVPGFGEIDLDPEQECYEAQLDFEGRVVELDLNIDDELADPEVLASTGLFVENLDGFDRMARQALADDYRDGEMGSAEPYWTHHLQELGAEKLGGASEDVGGLLSALQLRRVGFYPLEPEQFAVFDYSLGESLTNYLLVVNFDVDGEVAMVVMES